MIPPTKKIEETSYITQDSREEKFKKAEKLNERIVEIINEMKVETEKVRKKK